MTYTEQLQHPKWKAKRHQILSRDLHMCTQCGNNKTLNVHHTRYLRDKLAWEYPGDFLVTLCNKCHKAKHRIKASDSIHESFRIIGSAVAGIKGLSRG